MKTLKNVAADALPYAAITAVVVATLFGMIEATHGSISNIVYFLHW